MPIPFRDEAALDRFGSAALLRIAATTDDDAFLGALFLVNAAGEPLEFTYNRLQVVHRFLWRAGDLRRHVARRMTASLFEVCPQLPIVILCLADEASAELFSEDLAVELPTARLAPVSAVIRASAGEARELMAGPIPVQVFWGERIPGDGHAARSLVGQLVRQGLLMEAFDRALVGLREVYGSAQEPRELVGRD